MRLQSRLGRREEQADLGVLQGQRRPAVEQAAVELEDVLKIEIAALRHVVEEAREIGLRLLGLALGGLQKLLPQPVRQKLHAVGEEAEDELIDEMRHRLAIGIAMLERVRNRLELVRGFLRKLRARAARTELVGLEEDGAKTIQIDRLREIVELEFVFRRRLVGPARLDAEDMRVAGDMQRRIFERGGVVSQLFERLVEIALLLFVLPGEEALLPDIGPSFAAADLGRALFEGKMVADRIVLGGSRVVEQPAEVDEMLLRRRPFGQRHRLPFADEVLRGHWGRGGPRRSFRPISMSRRNRGG